MNKYCHVEHSTFKNIHGGRERTRRSVTKIHEHTRTSSKPQDKLLVLPQSLFAQPSPPRKQSTQTTAHSDPVDKDTAATTRRSCTKKHTTTAKTTTTTTTTSKTLQTLESVLKFRCTKYGPHHAKVAQVWNWMGNHHLQLSERKPCELVQAMNCFRQALPFRKCTESAEALSNMGSIHRTWGDVPQAIRCSHKALSRLRSTQGRQEFHNSRTNTSKAKILLQLGLAYLASHDPTHQQRAKDCLFRSLSLSLDACGPHHMHVGKAYQALAKASLIAGQWTKAMNYHVRALGIFSKHQDCIRVVGTLQDLVETCVLRQDRERAKAFLQRREQLLQQPKVQQFFWNCPGLLESAMATTGALLTKVESLEATNTSLVETRLVQSIRSMTRSTTGSTVFGPVVSMQAQRQHGASRSSDAKETVPSMKVAFSRFHAIACLEEV